MHCPCVRADLEHTCLYVRNDNNNDNNSNDGDDDEKNNIDDGATQKCSCILLRY